MITFDDLIGYTLCFICSASPAATTGKVHQCMLTLVPSFSIVTNFADSQPERYRDICLSIHF